MLHDEIFNEQNLSMLSSEKKKTSSLISMPHLQVFDESETENYSTGGQCKLWQSLSLDIVLIQDVNWFSVVTSLYIKQKNHLRW